MEAFNQYVNKLRSSGLRPTKQRLMISKLLFGQKKTLHFTIENLIKLIKKNMNQRIKRKIRYLSSSSINFQREGPGRPDPALSLSL